MRASSPVVATMIEHLRKRLSGRATRPLDRLYRMWLNYPKEPLERALELALEHGLYDLKRIERLVLERVAGDFFCLPDASHDTTEDTE
jgi:hypothetical protein